MTTDVRPTLRALSGAPAEPIALRDSTLILIDCQQIVAASVLQNASLAALSDLFAVVVRSGADVP